MCSNLRGNILKQIVYVCVSLENYEIYSKSHTFKHHSVVIKMSIAEIEAFQNSRFMHPQLTKI